MAPRKRVTPSRRIELLGAMAVFLALTAAAAPAATRTVYVGRGGTNFVDEVSQTNQTTINEGDMVTWVWEGTMMHSVTSGTCPAGGGGGGYGYGTTGGPCTAGTDWPAAGLHDAGFSFSHTFTTAGTYRYFCDAHQGSMTGKVVVQPASGPVPCVVNPQTLCLNGGRFAVTADWTKRDGTSGQGTGVKLTGDSGYFWFFDASNIEVTIKVLNACGQPVPAYWVFAAGLTNVNVHLKVVDSQTGAEFAQDNPQGTAFAPIQSTGAFPTSCP